MTRLTHPFLFEIGPYGLLLPESCTIEAEVMKPPAWAVQKAWTQWKVSLGRFRLGMHLDPLQEPSRLGEFIESSTKRKTRTRPIEINGIHGATFGGYDPPRTWIDWWLKGGDLMICLNLQSIAFPVTKPTDEEIQEHNAIISSITYVPSSTGNISPTP